MDVQNEQGKSITSGDPSLNSTSDILKIPLLDSTNGLVIVSYSVISKDGHPINGSISFHVKDRVQPTTNATNGKIDSIVSKDKKDALLEELETKSSSEIGQTTLMSMQSSTTDTEDVENKTATPLSSIIKSAYLLSLLLLSGTLLWRFRGYKIPYLVQTQLLHLVMLVLFTWSQARNFSRIFESISWQDLFLRTDVGQFWTATLVITVLGLYIVGRNRYVDLAWLAGLLLVKSLNSHAIASNFPIVTISLNFVHLLFSSLWITGLVYALFLWKKGLAQVFIRTFSKMALLSIVILTLTGSIYAWLLSPSLSLLWTTTWGYWLIAKIITVIGVFILGTFIRRHMKRNGSLLDQRYLYFDCSLSIIILLIVGVLTQLSSSI